MRNMPGSKRPMTSPGQASSMAVRSAARNWLGLARRTSLPSREWNALIPLVYRPDTTRMKAMRSRCEGSMFA